MQGAPENAREYFSEEERVETWSGSPLGYLIGREEKKREIEHLFAEVARRPLNLPRRRILVSLGARLCIRYLPMWYL